MPQLTWQLAAVHRPLKCSRPVSGPSSTGTQLVVGFPHLGQDFTPSTVDLVCNPKIQLLAKHAKGKLRVPLARQGQATVAQRLAADLLTEQNHFLRQITIQESSSSQ